MKIPVDRLVTASAAHPWLAIQGDTVLVRLFGGHVLATAVGPNVPEEGAFPVPKTSPCSFTLTFTAASKALPLRAAAFSALDEYGRVHVLTVTTAAGKPLPASIPQGTTITLRLSATLPTGEGQLRWTPQGSEPIVSWDFDVEID